jgi:hypothetical protein
MPFSQLKGFELLNFEVHGLDHSWRQFDSNHVINFLSGHPFCSEITFALEFYQEFFVFVVLFLLQLFVIFFMLLVLTPFQLHFS